MEIFLTDDGCSDSTVPDVQNSISNQIPVHIISGDGNRYWAGGMCDAWNEAKKSNPDYYLLLNDDSVLFEDCLDELLKTHSYCLDKYGVAGVYSGITTDPDDITKVTYGGSVWDNRFLGIAHHLPEASFPQECDTTNANIMLVPREVVDKIGIFYNGYTHACADYDYAYMAKKKNVPVLITQKSCGTCANDHTPGIVLMKRLCDMSLRDRKKYFSNPIHSNKDYLTYIRRVTPWRLPIVVVGRFINVYFPKLYVVLYEIRTRKQK